MPDTSPPDDPWSPGSATLAWDCAPVRVRRLRDDVATTLPGLVCESIEERIGPHWPTATLRYELGTTAPSGSPATAFEAVDSFFTGPYVLDPGDEVLVEAQRPDAVWVPIFHGTAYNWSFQFSAAHESTLVHCFGIARSCWDLPLTPAVWLDTSEGLDALETRGVVLTDKLARFNPRGEPCMAATDYPVSRNGHDYWLFVDPTQANDDPPLAEVATLWKAACYTIYEGQGNAGNITLPEPSELRALLIGREPKEGYELDPSDPETYYVRQVDCRDLPITGKAWPNVLQEIIGDQGYTFFFETTAAVSMFPDGANPIPETALRVICLQSEASKPLVLQPRGAALNLGLSNVGSVSLTRDLHDLANRWIVDGAPIRYEVGIVLKPAFPMVADDASAANLPLWESTKISPAQADWIKYREWIFNEAGIDSWYVEGTTEALTRIGDLTPVFGEPDDIDPVSPWFDPFRPPKQPRFVPRRRVPVGELLTTDDAKQPLRASLWISTDYVLSDSNLFSGPHVVPATFAEGENAGHWQPCQRGWKLLKDRLGIRLTCENPNSWHIGKSDDDNAPFPSGAVNVVECLNSVNGKAPFYLKLVVCVDGDRACRGVAERREVSPLPFDVERRIDARERYRQDIIDASSHYNAFASPATVRNDDPLAKAEAEQHRLAAEAGVMGGTAVIPRFTDYYRLGDCISGIWGGEGCAFNTGTGAVPVYPVVIARRFDFRQRQTTTLELSDARHLIDRRYRDAARPRIEDHMVDDRRGLF